MRVRGFGFAALLLAAAPLLAQDAAAPARAAFTPTTQTYGTSAETVLSISAASFQPEPGSLAGGNFGYKYPLDGVKYLVAPIQLPAGALITRLEVEGCDSDAWGQIWPQVKACTVFNECVVVGDPVTSAPDQPGCGRFGLPVSLTVNNQHFAYAFVFNSATLGQSVGINAARVYYKLQVSPAPATATFADVPTSHPFFQYVEALAASGITTGCTSTPPQFCPDAFITRGQMAVFLARALGLHWAP